MKKSLTLTLGLALSPWAAANDDIQLLQQLFQQGQSVDAYELGLELQPELEGNSQFDYYFGAAAIDSGDASQGVFALERVLIQQPNNQAARLELARGYFDLEEYQRSRKEFETAMQGNPPQEVKDKIQRYLDAIRQREGRYRSSAQGFFRFGLGQDSNANSATGANQLDDITPALATTLAAIDPNFTTTLDDASREADSSFSDVAAGVNLTFPLTPSFTLKAGTSLQSTIYNDSIASNFNTTSFNFHAGVDQRLGEHIISYGLAHQALLLTDEFFRNTSNLILGWRYKPRENNQLAAYARFQQTENELGDNANQRDIDGQVIGFNYSHAFTGKLSPLLVAGISYGSEEPQDQNSSVVAASTRRAKFERDYYGINIGGQISLNNRHSLGASANWLSSEYGAPDSAFQNKTRDDDLTSLRIEHNFLVNKRWKLNSYASYTDNSSNITISDYDRTRVGINFIYETN